MKNNNKKNKSTNERLQVSKKDLTKFSQNDKKSLLKKLFRK
ncbi:hypothetical protein HMPREF0789_1512 [Staphylococcus epidermidis BCM-HMP0060]|nr:hypothetical protein HMPREF0789_1512 [Staphylococcus epidermidis BCM-HMP0060]